MGHTQDLPFLGAVEIPAVYMPIGHTMTPAMVAYAHAHAHAKHTNTKRILQHTTHSPVTSMQLQPPTAICVMYICILEGGGGSLIEKSVLAERDVKHIVVCFGKVHFEPVLKVFGKLFEITPVCVGQD